jgi:hypothetical protein
MSYFKQFFFENRPEFSVIIDDDDKVCYGYLYIEKNIVGDVWLYNSIPAPKEPEWHTRENLPFLNSPEFIKENIKPFNDNSKVEVKWIDNSKIVAYIYVESRLIAKLTEGSCPGWSCLVIKDGRLAIIM